MLYSKANNRRGYGEKSTQRTIEKNIVIRQQRIKLLCTKTNL